MRRRPIISDPAAYALLWLPLSAVCFKIYVAAPWEWNRYRWVYRISLWILGWAGLWAYQMPLKQHREHWDAVRRRHGQA